MKSLTIDYQETSLMDDRYCQELAQMLLPEIEKISKALQLGYETDYAVLHLPSDDKLLATVDAAIKYVHTLQVSMVILIGIGGSNLGTLALFQALYGSFYNNLHPALKFYCADTIDTDLIQDLLTLAQAELKKGLPIIINVVTKSGTTTETLVNASLFAELIKRYYPQDYKRYIIITTDKQSALWKIAQQEGFYILEIPSLVGGRYSVLSAVGLFPLGLLGVDIDQLRQGALAMRAHCLSKALDENSAAQSASLIYAHYKQGKTIHDTFIFDPLLAQLGAWYRQLVGESLGKKENMKGILVEVGITPTISLGTTDLHSVGQLYLGGPRDKFTTFIYTDKQNNKHFIPNNEFTSCLPYLIDKPIETVKQAIFKGVKAAYAAENRPFQTIRFPEVNAYTLGQFLMLKTCEVLYTAYFLDINPFDQPAVELYKSETHKLLNNDR